MKNILYIPEDDLEYSVVVAFLHRQGFAYSEQRFSSLSPREVVYDAHFLCIFEIVQGEQKHLDIIREMKTSTQFSGIKPPPFIVVVEHNDTRFERSARSAEVDFYFTAPLQERELYHAISQSRIASQKNKSACFKQL